MNISHHHTVGNSTKLLADHRTNQSNYLEPDYFLPSSQSESYYSRKYGRSISRISRIVSASLLSAMVLTATLDAKAHPSVESEEITVQLPQGNDSNAPRWFKFKNPLSHLSNILGFNSSNTTPKTEEKPITIEELQDLYNNDPEEQDQLSKHVISQDSYILPSYLPVEEQSRAAVDDGAVEAATSTQRISHKLPKIIGYRYKEPLIPNNHYKARPNISIGTFNTQDKTQSEISSEELNELYAAEYGESIDESINQTQGSKRDALARTLNRTLAIREREIERRKAESIFAEVGTQDYAKNTEYFNNASYWNENISDTTDIYSKPIDNISLASSSSGSDAEPWSDPDIEIGEAFTSEFAPSASPLSEFSLPKQIEPSAPPLSAFSTYLESKGLENSSSDLTQEELRAIEILDQAIEDSGYSSPSCHSHSRSNSGANSPSMASRLNQDSFTSNNQTVAPLLPPQTHQTYSDSSSSSYEYDTDEDIRSYENVPANNRTKRYIKRKERGHSYQDIEQGLSELHSDTDFSDEWSDEDGAEETVPYDTVYTSSGSEYSDDSSDEYAEAAKAQNDSEDISGNDRSDSEYTSSDDEELPLPPPPTQDELARLTELDNLSEVSESKQTVAASTIETLAESISSELSEVQEESDQLVSSDMFKQETAEEDIQDSNSDAAIDAETDISAGSQAISDTDTQTTDTEEKAARSKEELLKKATMVAASHNQARKISKISSKQIRHRIFTRDIVTAAVAAGDDEADNAAEQTRSYSIWSSGTLGSNKQKSHVNSDGYSSKIAGGTIGLELNLENDLLVGSGFSKFNSRVKYQDQGGASDLRSSAASNRAKYDTHIFSLYGLSPVSRNMSISLIGSAGLSKGKKVRTKLLSFEPHLNYRVELPRAVTLIPHIGLRYEYEKVSRHKEQIASSLSIERSKKSYQALNGEIGSRVIFAPIKLNGSTPRAISITPTAHFSVERRIGSRGKSNPFTLTYYETQQTIGTGIVSTNAQNERTSLNAGIGLIAGSQNIKLELLYDQQRQKRFKSHQGVLKLKVSL